MYPYVQFAHDGITFMKTMLKCRGWWSGPVVDVSMCPPITPPTKRSQNQYVIAQALIHAWNSNMAHTHSNMAPYLDIIGRGKKHEHIRCTQTQTACTMLPEHQAAEIAGSKTSWQQQVPEQ